MIPTRLELTNFLAYRNKTVIDFEGMHLACLVGPNGAGKSSILDAITWALWGASRTRTQDELVHQGQDYTRVQLDFLHEGVAWRVERIRKRGKDAKSTLLLQRRTPNGQFVLQANGVSETQKAIEALLKLDFATFVNSAFLQQGRADLFMTKTPAERKKTLSNILGLDQWAEYESRAKERASANRSEAETLAARIREIETELAQRPTLQSQLDLERQRYADALQRLDAARARTEELRAVKGLLDVAKANHESLNQRITSRTRDLESVQRRIKSAQDKIDAAQTLIAQRAAIEQGYQAYLSAQQVDESLREKLEALNTLKDQRTALEKQLTALQAELKTQSINLAKRIADARKLINQNPSEQLAQAQAELDALLRQQAERERLHQHITTIKEQRGSLESTLKALEREGKTLNERKARLEEVTDPTCPLCGQPLTDEHRHELLAEIEADVTAKRAEYSAARDAKKQLEADLKQAEADISVFDSVLKALPYTQKRVGELQAQVDAAQKAATQLEIDEQERADIDRTLNEETFGMDLRHALADLRRQEEALGYDKPTHTDAQNTLKRHQHFLELKTRLDLAESGLAEQQQILADEHARLAEYTQEIDTARADLLKLEQDIARYEIQYEEFLEREKEQYRLTDEANSIRDSVTRLEHHLTSLSAQETRKAQLEVQRNAAREQETLYNQLAESFGKNGVPLMLIETAIPELESDANDLLARMTGGRMHVRLITQRDTKSGTLSETLDIEIADELGTRSYDLFSGGEAFRVNFALRIALSKLLARRAGAHLRTLFIDEGFGTQDDDGRAKLVEALNVIQDDFDLILVITHIDELRESFPVQIMVEKGADGSRVRVR